VLDYSLRDSALTIGLTLLQESNENFPLPISTQIKNMLESDASTLFILGIRYIVRKAQYHSIILTMWEKDHKKIVGQLVELLHLLQKKPSNPRNARVLDILGIEHRKYTPADDTLLESDIMLYGATTKDQIHQLRESLTLVEAITQQGS